MGMTRMLVCVSLLAARTGWKGALAVVVEIERGELAR